MGTDPVYVRTQRIFDKIGFYDRNKNGVIEKPSILGPWRDEGYVKEADRNSDGKINRMEAWYHYYLLNGAEITGRYAHEIGESDYGRDKMHAMQTIHWAAVAEAENAEEKIHASVDVVLKMGRAGYSKEEIRPVLNDALRLAKKGMKNRGLFLINIIAAGAQTGCFSPEEVKALVERAIELDMFVAGERKKGRYSHQYNPQRHEETYRAAQKVVEIGLLPGYSDVFAVGFDLLMEMTFVCGSSVSWTRSPEHFKQIVEHTDAAYIYEGEGYNEKMHRINFVETTQKVAESNLAPEKKKALLEILMKGNEEKGLASFHPGFYRAITAIHILLIAQGAGIRLDLADDKALASNLFRVFKDQKKKGWRQYYTTEEKTSILDVSSKLHQAGIIDQKALDQILGLL